MKNAFAKIALSATILAFAAGQAAAAKCKNVIVSVQNNAEDI